MTNWKQWKYKKNPVVDRHTNTEFQGNLLREYECKFEQLPEDEKLSKLCFDTGFGIVEKDNSSLHVMQKKGPDEMKNLCRENTPRSGSIPGEKLDSEKTQKIGPVLDVKVFHHQDRYGVEIMVETLFQDGGTASCVRIVNGINKYISPKRQKPFPF